MFLLPIIIFLPLIEIIGFVVIGGRIGLGLSLLWLIADVIVGSMLLRSINGRTLHVSQNPENEEDAMLEDMFDGVCILVGALLLIFPGFISDFLALPLIIPPVRHLIFLYLKNKHDGVLDNINTRSQSFTYWHTESGESPHTDENAPPKTIDGEFKNVDDDKRLK